MDRGWRRWMWTVPMFLLVAGVLMLPVLPHAASTVFDSPARSDLLQYVYFADHFAEAITGSAPFFHLEKICYPDGVHLGQISISPVFTVPGGALIALTGIGPILAHNILYLLFIALTGLVGALYAARFTADRRVAVAAGVLLMMSPVLIQGIAHVSNVGLFLWIPLAFLAVERVLDDPRPRNAAVLAVAVLLQAGSSLEYAAYLGVMGPLYLIVAVAIDRSRLDRERIRMFALAAMLTAGIGLLYYSRFQVAGFDAGGVLAIDAHSWLLDVPRTWIPIAVVVPATGYVIARFHRTDLLPLYVTGLVAVPLALGTQAPYEPYVVLYKTVPFLGYFRTPTRVLAFTVIGLAVALPVLLVDGIRRRPIPVDALFVIAAAAGLFLTTIPLHEIHGRPLWEHETYAPEAPEVYSDIAAAPGDAVVWYPLVQYPENVYASTQYDKATIECGATTAIPSETRFTRTCGEAFFAPTADCRALLDRWNVSHLVTHRERFDDWFDEEYTGNRTMEQLLVHRMSSRDISSLNLTMDEIRSCPGDLDACYRMIGDRYAALPMTTVVSQDENMTVYRLNTSR